MKVLHVNTSDITGGAARAAYRLHKALLAQNIDSKMLVQTKAGDERTVIGPVSKVGKGIGHIRPTLDQLPNRLYPHKKQTPFHAAWLPVSGVVDKIQKMDPDVVHLHWVAGGFVRIEDLAKIKKPIVWSLHDMWAFTGGCHYDGGCGRYTSKCGLCPVLGAAKDRDLSSWIFRRKQKGFARIPSLTINGLSRWLSDCAESSALFEERSVVNLPNPIDTEVYKPLPKKQAKQLLGLSLEKRHILFGAMSATKDERKGFFELVQALEYVHTDNIELAVFGSGEPENAPKFPFLIRYLGRLKDDISLRILYSAADVMVVPSRQEAFGQTATEAMACGTPVVAFKATGLLDIVDHQINGYLAAPYYPKDLAKGIDWILGQVQRSTTDMPETGQRAREKVVREFDSNLVARKYIELYEQMLSVK